MNKLKSTFLDILPILQRCGVDYDDCEVGCVAQWYNVGLWPANFPCPALDL